MENPIRSTFLPKEESGSRIARLQASLEFTDLDGVLVFDWIEQLYYAGTIQNGFLYIPVKGSVVYFVRRSLERACMESPLPFIYPYTSFRDVAGKLSELGIVPHRLGVDESSMTVAYLKMLTKTFSSVVFSDAGMILKRNRSVKSSYEIEKMRKAGEVSRQIIREIPSFLRDGITEWELALALHGRVSELGKNCLSRLSPGSGEFFLGNVCFGDSSIKPTAFDGPGGMPGISPACPYGGSERQLKAGDLIYIDIGYPFEEYYVDKTRLFFYKGEPDQNIRTAHEKCLKIQEAVRKRLTAGAIPSTIYEEVMAECVGSDVQRIGLMGHAGNQVKFFGHGIGMVINEFPVIAKKFDEPLKEGMTMAVEPKQSIPGIGLVGIENTFLVTKDGGENLTSDSDDIILVG